MSDPPSAVRPKIPISPIDDQIDALPTALGGPPDPVEDPEEVEPVEGRAPRCGNCPGRLVL